MARRQCTVTSLHGAVSVSRSSTYGEACCGRVARRFGPNSASIATESRKCMRRNDLTLSGIQGLVSNQEPEYLNTPPPCAILLAGTIARVLRPTALSPEETHL